MKLKKKKGSIGKMGITMISIVGIFIGLIISLNGTADSKRKDEIDMLIRDYILEMETKGYLTIESQDALYNDLRELGVSDISLAGTTTTQVGYGEDIYLTVTGNMEITEYDIKDLFDISSKEETIPIKVSKKSTAKH